MSLKGAGLRAAFGIALVAAVVAGCGEVAQQGELDLADPEQTAVQDLELALEGRPAAFWERLHPAVQDSTTRVEYLECASDVGMKVAVVAIEVREVQDVEVVAVRSEQWLDEVELRVAADGDDFSAFLYYEVVEDVARIADVIPASDKCVSGLLEIRDNFQAACEMAVGQGNSVAEYCECAFSGIRAFYSEDGRTMMDFAELDDVLRDNPSAIDDPTVTPPEIPQILDDCANRHL